MKNEKIRNHFSAIVEDIFKFFWSIIILLLAYSLDFIDEISTSSLEITDVLIFIGGILTILLVIFIIFFIKWLKTTIEIIPSAIIIDRNTIIRKTTNINIKDISTIDISQNILEKFFKTAKIQLDINSVVTASENDMKIILKYNDALEFQRKILNLMDKNESAKEERKIVLEEFDYEYDFKSIIKHTILSYNVVLIILLLITYIPMILFSEFDFYTFIIGGLFVVVPFIFGAVKGLFSYYNFKLKKEEDKINISYGYFTRKKFSMPYSKISGIKITQPLLARFFKLYSVELINIGYAEENYVSLLLPLDTKEEIRKKLNYLFPNMNLDFDSVRQNRAALLGYFIDNFFWMVITLSITFFTHYILGFVVLLLWLIGITLSYLTKRISYKNKVLYITNGIYNKSIVICSIRNIQNITLRKNLFINKYNICKMRIVLRSNLVNTNHETGYFDIKVFDELIKKYN